MSDKENLTEDNKKIRNRFIILVILLISILVYNNLTSIKPVDYSKELIDIYDYDDSIKLTFKEPITSYLTFSDYIEDYNSYKIISIQPYYTLLDKLIKKSNNNIIIDKSKYDAVLYNSPKPFGSKILYDPNNHYENSGTEFLPRKGLNLLTVISAVLFIILLILVLTIFRSKDYFKKIKIVQIPLCFLISNIIININKQGTYTYGRDMILAIITYIIVHLLINNYINYKKQNHRNIQIS